MINYLSVENVTYHYGDILLFNEVSFGVAQGQKVALIARNGAGKTTLFNILTGNIPPQAGAVTIRNGIEVGYLHQDPYLNPANTVLQELFDAPGELIKTIQQYENAIQHNNIDKIAVLTDKMDHLNAWDYENRIKQILSELKVDQFDQLVGNLSGGQKKRVALAKVLLSEPDFILLDEPTNHLDLDMIEWLEQYLSKSKATLLMITHDRYFLDRVCNHILELDDETIYQYQGNYKYFLEKREERINLKTQEIEKARNLLQREQDWMNRQPQARATKAKYRIDAYYDLKDVANQKLDNRSMDLNITGARLGKKILELDHISKAYNNLKLINNFTYKFARLEKVGIIGNNGTGKTTFLNIITRSLPPDTGTIEVGETVVWGYYQQQGIEVNDDKKVIEVISEISEKIDLGEGQSFSAAQFLRYFLFPNEMHYVQVNKLSGGERKRLHLMTVLMRNPNFLILDEPTNDLDIFTLNVLEEYLKSFKGCVIIVSHDRYFMDKVVDHVFAFKGDGIIKDYPGNYSDYLEKRTKEERLQKKESTQIQSIVEKTNKNTYKLSYAQKRELEQLEKKLSELEHEKFAIEKGLADGSYSAEELSTKTIRFGEVLQQIEEVEMRWFELKEIEEIDN
ncbi:MAG: ABC-F family ATP-binding cassette domain-containing protein [Marinilabiliaceae bacterium]|nr:ABC-F family ATP-binding cassette domain-containing protein [Marinilabiliaceae bacterium]